jgi:membrane protease YdiL (CAAX protease family)
VLKLWQAVLGVVIGFVGGQLSGGVALVVALGATLAAGAVVGSGRIRALLDGLASDPLGDPALFIPMLAATGVVQTVLALLVPVFARVPVRASLGLDRAPLVAMLLAPIGALGLGPTSDLLATAFRDVLPSVSLGNLEAITAMAKEAPFAVMFVLMAVLPGVSEELLFRGVLQRAIRRVPVAIAVSAVLFACAHVDPPHVVAVVPMGVYLAWVAWRSDSTWPTIAAHVVNNGLAVAASRIDALQVGHGTDAPMPPWWAPVGLFVTLACVAVIALFAPRRER